MSRVSKNALGQTTSFLRDGAYVTDPVIADNLAIYTPGISERRGGTTRYTHSGLKNTGAQSTNAIVATRVYDAYGMVRSTTGTWSGPFGYAGDYGYQEDETGLRLLGHRYYDSSTSRFLTRDPIKDGRNWYSYCDGDPINGVDPNGLDWYYHQTGGELAWSPGKGGTWFDIPGLPTKLPLMIPIRDGGWSGRGGGPWRDNPEFEYKKMYGPIPRGKYKNKGFHDKTREKKPMPCVHLDADDDNDVRGRNGFLIHGGNKAGAKSSIGCIVFSNVGKKAREKLERLLRWIGGTGETVIVWR